MTEAEALSKLIPPGQKRPWVWQNGVLQIWVTRACDKACFGCTQASNLRGPYTFMPVELFEEAVKSLKGYFGVIGIFGGNPSTHPQFEKLCEILKRYVPFTQRGIWCNNPLGKAAIMQECFNPEVSNLNVHLDRKAFDEFKRDWPESRPFGLEIDSRHWPSTVAMIDIIPDESERWDKISKCDINRRWSAMIGLFRGELRGWFCEIAGSHSMYYQNDPSYPDTGVKIEAGWWKRPMSDFAHQVRYHCHRCGIPLNGLGPLASDETGTELVSITHSAMAATKRPNRKVTLVTDRSQIVEQAIADTTEYIANGKRV